MSREWWAFGSRWRGCREGESLRVSRSGSRLRATCVRTVIAYALFTSLLSTTASSISACSIFRFMRCLFESPTVRVRCVVCGVWCVVCGEYGVVCYAVLWSQTFTWSYGLGPLRGLP